MGGERGGSVVWIMAELVVGQRAVKNFKGRSKVLREAAKMAGGKETENKWHDKFNQKSQSKRGNNAAT